MRTMTYLPSSEPKHLRRICKEFQVSVLIFFLIMISSSPAAACFPCLWGTGQKIAASEDEQLELAVLPSPPVATAREIRHAFELAYGKQRFASDRDKEEAFVRWKDTIPDSEMDGGIRSVEYFLNPNFYISATLERGGQLSFSIDASNSKIGIESGKELGLERDSGAGLFARAFVALGGRGAVNSLDAQWLRDSANTRKYDELIENGFGKLAAANGTFTGKMAERFYGLTATSVVTNSWVKYRVLFGPKPSPETELSVGLH